MFVEKAENKRKRGRGWPIFKKKQAKLAWAAVETQLAEWSLLTSEIRGSNPVIGKFYLLSTLFYLY